MFSRESRRVRLRPGANTMTKLGTQLILTAAALSTFVSACGSNSADAGTTTTSNGTESAGTTGSAAPPATQASNPGTNKPASMAATAGSTAATPTSSGNSAGSTADTASAAGAAATAATAGSASTPTTSTGAAGAVAAAGTSAAGAAAAGTGATAGDPTAQCVSGLKKLCEMHETAGCSSVNTVDVGTLVKATEIPLGPYGAIMETNVGQGFEVPEASGEADCASVAASFGEPANTTANILDLKGSDLKLYTVYRPACMREGEKYPVITWGNGTCGQSGGYAGLLAAVASHGFVVIAANSRFTDAGNKEMTRALDFAKAINEDSANPLFGKLDLSKVGAMGHSQGGSATVNAASDPRIKSVILWNGGGSAVKPFLAISGERDIGNPTPATMASAVNAAAQPGAWLFFHKVLQTGGNFTGHLTLMMQPERVIDVTVAWWKYQLNGDAEAKKQFVGTDCGLCNKKDEYEFGMKGLQ